MGNVIVRMDAEQAELIRLVALVRPRVKQGVKPGESCANYEMEKGPSTCLRGGAKPPERTADLEMFTLHFGAFLGHTFITAKSVSQRYRLYPR